MFAEGRNRGKFSCDSGIEEGNEKDEAVRGVGDDAGRKQGMGMPAGGTEAGTDADPAVAYAAAGIADKMPAVRAIMAVCGCGCMAGRTAAGSRALCYRKAGLLYGGIDGMLIQIFDLVKSLANVKEKSYHSVVGSAHGSPWLMKEGKTGGGP